MTGSYRTYSSLVKLQPLVPEFAVEDLPLGRTAAFVTEFAVKYLSFGRTLDDDEDDDDVDLHNNTLKYAFFCKFKLKEIGEITGQAWAARQVN